MGLDKAKRSCELSNRDEEGYDIFLIREMLRMTPDQRLEETILLLQLVSGLR